MSAMRVLVLGLLSQAPRPAADIRRTLEAWHAEQWAGVAYGAVSAALARMAAEGLVAVVGAATAAKRPTRSSYAITERGQAEFLKLLREYWWDEKPTIDPFQVALTFMDRLPRAEVLAALRHRAARSRAFLEAWRSTWPEALPPGAPRVVAENRRLDIAHVEAETHWMEQAIAKIERGELP